jgi:predicted TPR repeat methyltransferase
MSGTNGPDEEERRAKAFLADAYALETQADTLAFYHRWADEYDTQLERGLNYVAPRVLAEALARHRQPGDAPILDVGCGTGLTCCCLRELGFSTIDGIDFSRAMLDKAAEKGVYRKLVEADLNNPLPFDDAAYAAAISTGTFTLGHVGPEPLDEVLRVLTPGAIFACTVHVAIWEPAGFERKFAELEASGVLCVVEQHVDCFFEDSEPTARYCVFQKSEYAR